MHSPVTHWGINPILLWYVADYIMQEKKFSYVRPVKDVHISTGNIHTLTRLGREDEQNLVLRQ